jgi:hypothetical protein
VEATVAAPSSASAPGWLVVVLTILFYGVAFAIACATPFLAFDPMMIAIIGFSLWEAWKLNKRVPMVLRGPFRVAAPSAAPAEAVE